MSKQVVDKSRLEEVDKKIRYHIGTIKKSYMFIGKYLLQAKPMVEDIQAYAFEQYGFKKSTTYNMMRVFEEFGQLGMDEYSYTKLVDMLSMTPEEREEITPDMSVQEIRDVKKKNKEAKEDSNKLENENQEDSNKSEKESQRDSNKLENKRQLELDVSPEKKRRLLDYIDDCITIARENLSKVPRVSDEIEDKIKRARLMERVGVLVGIRTELIED